MNCTYSNFNAAGKMKLTVRIYFMKNEVQCLKHCGHDIRRRLEQSQKLFNYGNVNALSNNTVINWE